MKQKIKIMNTESELLNEDVSSYMDFGKLLDERNKALRSERYRPLKWIIPFFIVTGVVSVIVLQKEQRDTAVREADEYVEESVKHTSKQQKEVVQQPTSDSLETIVPTTPSDARQKSKAAKTAEVAQKHENNAAVAESVYLPAQPVNGYPELYTYFNENLIYPPEAVKDSVQGMITVKLDIDVEGKPKNIQINNSLGPLFEKEAIRLVENMPAWKPATLNGKPMNSKISLPLTFRIRKIKPPK